MKYQIKRTGKFKKDLKKAIARGYNMALMDTVVTALSEGRELDEKYHDHLLNGDWTGYRVCHILPDWLLIYKYDNDDLILYLTRTGSHSDLFK
ncbi:MAG: type II toxin-antitoxin system YafQ family toxin [Lachnospiraceae bacterium]|nr:type II toxin-antitoxin system YafQ family toxin [Lachnospiraceae bacterium]